MRKFMTVALGLVLLTGCEGAENNGTLEAGAERVRAIDGMTQVYVPAGTFEMGSAEIEQPTPFDDSVHKVSLDSFWIDMTEVTVQQYEAFVAATGHKTIAEYQGSSGTFINGDFAETAGAYWKHPNGPETTAEPNHPVVQMAWFDADAYCKWAGGSLPTEAQWEYAARGPELRTFPWGNTYDPANLNACEESCATQWKTPGYDDGFAETAPVGTYPAGKSWVGALDMAGNAWEWVNDWQGDYGKDPQTNPTGPETGEKRVLRGGGWISGEASAWSAFRGGNPPYSRGTPDGFRCVSVE